MAGSASLVLWDIDGTLGRFGAGAYEVYWLAFRALTGDPPTRQVEISGRTELEIMADLLDRHGRPAATDEQMCTALVGALDALAGRLAADGRVLPGVRPLLTRLHERPEVVQSVLTGNIRPNAARKLDLLGLAGYLDLDVGGYGSDHAVRSRLVDIARRRAAARYETSFEPASTVLIGDTPRDVHAGLAGGARVVAVATGRYSVDALRAAGATTVLTDLRDPTAEAAILATG